MSQTLDDVARQLKDTNKKVQLIYAFNGVGKTRLSRAFKALTAPGYDGEETEEDAESATLSRDKILYYNAFTEDLFYWDNDLLADAEPKLKIQPNTFTDWLITLLEELGEDANIAANFQRYTDSNVNPVFNGKYKETIKNFNGKEVRTTITTFSNVSFQVAVDSPNEVNYSSNLENGKLSEVQGKYKAIKISKGEESSFIWSMFFTLLQQVILTLDETKEEDRVTDKFNNLEYIFIDDPVSSLDDNHLIALAVDLADLIKTSRYVSGKGLRFIVTTHNPLFYNVLFNELSNDLERVYSDNTKKKLYKRSQSKKYRLQKKIDGSFELLDSNDHPFSYHLFLLSELRSAIEINQIKKFHFNFLRNILEKTATFLGYSRWQDLLEKTADGIPDPFVGRILNLYSHSAYAGLEIAEIEDQDKERLAQLVSFLSETYHFKK